VALGVADAVPAGQRQIVDLLRIHRVCLSKAGVVRSGELVFVV